MGIHTYFHGLNSTSRPSGNSTLTIRNGGGLSLACQPSLMVFRKNRLGLFGFVLFSRGMKKSIRSLVFLLSFLIVGASMASAMQASVSQQKDKHRFGVGANYWVSLSDLDVDDVDDSGFSYLASYQYWMNHLAIELNVEFLPDRFGQSAWAPEAYILYGEGIYLAAGIGWINDDGDFQDSPFYAFRLGFDFKLFGNFYMDIAANYRFNDTADLEDSDTKIDTDTVFLGAAIRYGF